MFLRSRRSLLGASLTGLPSGQILAQDKPADVIPTVADDAPFQPSTLFLTWQRDPTTTMTVQWVGVTGETADTTISYAKRPGFDWHSQPTTTKPYPLTAFKVFRAELTGLAPGTDYLFRVG